MTKIKPEHECRDGEGYYSCLSLFELVVRMMKYVVEKLIKVNLVIPDSLVQNS